jgi:hypothetical protein
MKGYKLCEWKHETACIREGLLSYTGFQEYFLGKTNKRKKGWGPLAVFDTMFNAEIFIEIEEPKGSIDIVAFECEYTPSKDKNLWCPDYECNFTLPIGTVLADQIILVKEVKRWNSFSDSSLEE